MTRGEPLANKYPDTGWVHLEITIYKKRQQKIYNIYRRRKLILLKLNIRLRLWSSSWFIHLSGHDMTK